MNNKKILIIEESPLIEPIIRNHPISPGIITAKQFLEAAEIVRCKKIDIIFINHKKLYQYNPVLLYKHKLKYPNIKLIAILENNPKEIMRLISHGVDDYLIHNQFTKEDLFCRINKLLELYEYPILKTLTYKSLYLNKNTRELYFNRSRVLLSPKETILLEHMILNNGFSNKEDLISYISIETSTNYSNKALVMLISRLKRKLNRDTGHTLIRCRYTTGYYINL